jgi:transglutaminase-like putative cysteine protease
MLSTVVAVLALAPVLPYLGPEIMIIASVGVVAGVWCDRHEKYPLHGLTATVVAIAAIMFYAVQVSWIDVATPVTQALIALLIVRLLTPKESRDYLQIFVLALFILAGSSLVSLDLGLGFGFLTYLVLMIFSVILGLVLLTVFVTDKRLALPRQDLYKLVKVSLIMPVVSLILMVVFFFVLPRTRHPLWNFLNPVAQAKAGLSESVQPGSYASISSVKGLSFRAEVEELAPEDLYWRALVLNQPESNRWVRVIPPRENSRVINSSRAIKVTIYSESRSDRYLVTLDRPAIVSGVRYESGSDHVYTSRRDLNRSFRLEGLSHIGADLQVVGSVNRDFYLTLPGNISTRMRQLVDNMVSSANSEQERLAVLAEFFRNQELIYAQDDLPGGADPIDDFLFDSKRGYCEFFASAYVTLARLLGVPARFVGGYYGGEYNPLGGYYLVTEDTAHVWVEILAEDNRWIRIDPSQWAVNASSSLINRRTATLGALQRMVDSLNYRWTQTILLFDFSRQMNFLRDTREQFRRLRSPELEIKNGYWTGGLLFCIVVAVVLLRTKRLSPEARLLEELKLRLRKRYGSDAVTPASGLAELGERVDNDDCREFARIYQGAIFRDRSLSASEQSQLKEVLKRI